jgi:pSer/pThr/pTyr-binding forkhead associated (FHA) protein/tetratricopeptide (TPR) repeat protein
MAHLQIRLHGQDISTLELADGQEYVIGRAPDCAVVLTEQKGISRQHFKVLQQEGEWVAESLSKFVPLTKDGEQQPTVELSKETTFHASPYEFHFIPSPRVNSTEDAPVTTQTPASPFPTPSPREEEEVHGNLEATQAGVVVLIPFLKVEYASGEAEILKLEGDLWVAGRESSAEICLRNTRISRKHFEISRTREGFFVTDLGSSNGTRLNGQRIVEHEPTRLDSGDLLEVLDIQMHFEVRDLNLANRMLALPATLDMSQVPQNWQQQNQFPQLGGQVYGPPEVVDNSLKGRLENFDYKKHWVKLVIGGFIPVILIGALMPDGKSGRDPASAKEAPAFDRLTAEQKVAVKDTFNLARNLYVQGKYELCLAEIAKLNEMLPHYENSKEIGDYCEQGRELVKRQKDNDDRAHKAAMLEEKMKTIIDNCKEKLPKTASVEETSKCLAEAVELNPNHPAIAEMIQNAAGREEEAKILAQQRAARDLRTAKGEAEYRKAKALYAKGLLFKSISEYRKFLATPYPNLDGARAAAKRDVASAELQLQKKVSFFSEQCKQLGEKGRYKEAYIACDQALKEDPANDAVKQMRSDMLSNLRREIKSVYEDSVLEESMGNVDSAKEKWKKIKNDDLDFDEYAAKATILLKKYGVGM